MATVQELLVKINGDASGFKQAISQVENSVTKIGGSIETIGTKMSSVGKGMTAALTVPIAGVATKAVSSFAEVDKTMQLVNATMGNTEQQAALLDQAMKTAASNSTFGMSDAATATLNFARAGLSAEQAAAALAPAMNLAAGEGGNLDTVSSGLVATINGFGGTFDQAGQYADVFAAACNNSALDIDSLSGAMSVAAPIFSAAGYSVNDAALYMGVMANAGIEANVAANSLKTGLARLVSPPKEAAEMMDKLGISVTNTDGSMKDSVTIQSELHAAFSQLSESEQLAAASAIFGKNQMAPWLALINTAPESVNGLNTSLTDCAGTTEEMAEAMMSGFGGSLEKLKSSIDVLMVSLGEALAPTISEVAEKIQELVDWFNSLDKGQQEQIAKWGLLVAAIGPCLLIFGKITSGIGTLVTGFGKIGGAIGGAIGHFGKAGSAASKMAGDVGSAGSATASAATSFSSFAGAALKLAAVAAVILAAAAAVKILSDSAIQIAQAGPGAAAAFALLVAGAIGLTAGIAAIGSACTATAPGLLALGGTVLMITGGIAALVASVALLVETFSHLVDSISGLCDKMPLISEYGASAAVGLAEFGAALGVVAAGAIAAAPTLIALDAALAAFDVTAGLATPIVAALAVSIGVLDVAIIGLGASVKLCGEAFAETFETISTIVGTTVTAVCNFVSGLVEKVVGFFKDLKYQLIGDPIVIDMVNGIINWFKDLVKNVVDFVKGLVEKVVQFFTNLKDKAVELVRNMKEKVSEFFSNMKDKVVEIATNIKDKVTEKITNMKEKVTELVTNLKDKVKEIFTNMKEKVTETATNIKEKVQEKITQMKEKVSELVTNLKDKVQEKFTEIKDNITEKATAAKDKAKEKFTELKDAVKEKMQNTVDDVKQKCSDMADKFKGINLVDTGKDIVSGFMNGLKSAWEGVQSWVSNACDSIKQKFKAALKIGSPSKVFKEYGKFIDQGLIIGLETGETDISKQVDKLANGVMNGFTSSLYNTNGVSYGNANNSGNTVVNLNGDYLFQDKESMDYFLNRLGLVLARG